MVVEPWTPQERSKLSRPDLWTERATTDDTGHFRTGTTAKPGRYEATITVNHVGYHSVQHIFQHDRLHHQAIVILVKNDRASREEPHNNEMQVLPRSANGQAEREPSQLISVFYGRRDGVADRG